MKLVYLTKTIEIPEEIDITIDNKKVSVKGQKGVLTSDYTDHDIDLEKRENALIITGFFLNKKKKAKTLAVVGGIQNMIKGVTNGYVYKSKIVFSHFPITVEIKDKQRQILIKNLYGGRKVLTVPIVGNDTKVRIDKDDVIIEGIDKQAVGQTAANMQERCRLRGKRKKDPETFMDGIWVWQKKE